MTDPFLNAYHFTPVSEGVAKGDDTLPIEEVRQGSFGISKATRGDGHAVYVDDGHSGRLVCRLVAKTPLVVGGARTAGYDDPEAKRKAKTNEPPASRFAVIEPALRRGRPAIPATSIKGLVSSVAEALSGSALRVLTPRPLTYRKNYKTGALSAMARLVKHRDGWALEPLVPPLIQSKNNRYRVDNEQAWLRIFDGPCGLKTFVGDYRKSKKTRDFINTHLSPSLEASCAPIHFVYMRRPSHYDSLTELLSDVNDQCGALEELESSGNKNVYKRPGQPVVREPLNGHGKKGNRNVLGVAPYADEIVSYEESLASKHNDWVRGVLRVLGAQAEHAMPKGRKHEIFVPYPEGAVPTPIPLSEVVIDRFHAIASEPARGNEVDGQQRLSERRPHLPVDLPKEYSNAWERRDREGFYRPKLEHGQIVYFGIDPNAVVPERGPLSPEEKSRLISEISFSAIWRGGVSDEKDTPGVATIHDAFVRSTAEHGRELLPMSEDRTVVTPAERLFGFVPESKDGAPRQERAERPLRAVAGRVRFSDALLHGPVEFAAPDNSALAAVDGTGEPIQGGVVLRELGPPKPPSPSLYFASREGDKRVKKDAESFTLGAATPQGRKFYLHHDTKRNGENWISKRASDDGPHRRSIATPLKEGSTFWFQVDFDNLSTSELALLHAGLKPSATFWHKLGVGKALGLGSVEITPAALLLVDRRSRYESDDLDAPRYSRCALAKEFDLPERYADDWKTAVPANFDLGPVTGTENPWTGDEPKFPNALHALLEIGENHPGGRAGADALPPVLPNHVSSSQWDGHADPPETEGYLWFTEEGGHLKPLKEKKKKRTLAETALRSSVPRGGPRPGGKPPAPERRPAAGSPTQPVDGAERGRVKWYNPKKGYGFVMPQGGGDDVFLHVSTLEKLGLEDVREGDGVRYVKQPSKKKGKFQIVWIALD